MIIVEGQRSFRLAGQARVIEDARELAWAERHVRKDADIKWILGNFVEADRANDNGHIFPLEHLKSQVATVAPKPLNMLHHPARIVGCVTAAELLYPAAAAAASDTAAAAAAIPVNPYIEALSAFWRNFFPEEYLAVTAAHHEGSLFYSMECVPDSLTCPVDEREFEYRGCTDSSYCDHLNAPRSAKRLNMPHFNASALILPPVQPGWRNAGITQVSDLLALEPAAAQALYTDVAAHAPHLEPADWERTMAALIDLVAEDAARELARKYPAEKRRKLASEGKALPDGSFPIVDEEDLRNALQAFGRASDKAAAKRHIVKRARSLGKTDLIPADWQ